MPISKAQQKSVHKYVKNNYDRLEITVPKGNKAIITNYAQSKGESVNGFINRAVREVMQADGVTLPNERDNTQPETDGQPDADGQSRTQTDTEQELDKMLEEILTEKRDDTELDKLLDF